MADIVEYTWSPNVRLYRATREMLTPIIRWYFHADWSGVEHIPPTGAVVLACNHLSNLDPILLAAACPRQISYLAKIELFKVPLLGMLIKRFGAIPLRRSASDPEAMRLAECVLEQGSLLALFPEGTRSRNGHIKPFRFGAARLALKYNAALVPAAISGTAAAMPAGAKIPDRVKVRVAFGPALDLAPYRYAETQQTPEAAFISEATAKLQAAVTALKLELDQQ